MGTDSNNTNETTTGADEKKGVQSPGPDGKRPGQTDQAGNGAGDGNKQQRNQQNHQQQGGKQQRKWEKPTVLGS